MSQIELNRIDKYYGKNHVLKNLDLTIEEGEFMTLLGPSGCGKTTTLRIIAGLEKPQNGTINIGGKLVVDTDEAFFASPDKRGLNLVFQSYALWPHMTVFENVAFSMTIAKIDSAHIKAKVTNALKRMRILDYAKRYPCELSGGQQQRVAIARAIVNEPPLLLLDEPLSNLDAKLRVEMRSELKRLHQELGTTIVYVTHDQVEALTMSTRVAVFFDGVLEQVADPIELYVNPASLRVADFIGNPRINIIEGSACITNDGNLEVVSDIGHMVFPPSSVMEHDCPHAKEFKVCVGIRPEKIQVEPNYMEGGIEGIIYTSQPAGSETITTIHIGNSELLSKHLGLRYFNGDQHVWFSFEEEDIIVFCAETGKLIKKARTDL